jgi:hypothetical protein
MVAAGEVLILHDGGMLPDHFIAGPRSRVDIEGGEVGDFFQAVGSEVNIRGGRVGGAFAAFAGTEVTISGGTFGPTFDAYPRSTITLEGIRFLLDGVPLPELDEIGESRILTVRGDHRLNAVLADGSLFDLELHPLPDTLAFGRDYVDPAATLQLVVAATTIPEPGALVLCSLTAAVMGIGSRLLFAAPR